ncbi:hypothetical protein CDD83_3866 [Cordyceps sp. RAO-2017]|nr:hypothetical protein CDD83_3866 [Cordyceps sp. RAO-2017]
MGSLPELPGHLVVFGPGANCTLALCPVEWSVYTYRPSLAANVAFLVLFGAAAGVHVVAGVGWGSCWFAFFNVLGCVVEMAGYAGRVVLHGNPWSFGGFMVQIVFITTGPVFYTAAIYVTLSQVSLACVSSVEHLGPELSRFRSSLFYWVFIPADLVCLVLQAAGGALSSISVGSSTTGVHVAMAGLALQAATVFLFSAFFADYVIRYVYDVSTLPLSPRIRLFFGGLGVATVLILVRSVYRCYELSKGYRHSDLIRDQGLFIGLEGVVVVIAVFALCIGHPGLIFSPEAKADPAENNESSEEKA